MAGDAQLIDEYRTLHATTGWGGTSVKNLRYLRPLVRVLNPASVIDYGCGKSILLDELRVPGLDIRDRYDPAIPEIATLPDRRYDLLINVDVLEHIPEEDLDGVIAEMAGLADEAILVVDTRPAALVLEDGRNAHVSLYDHHWWKARLERHYGPIHPIRVSRRGRAAFRTWPMSLGQRIAWGWYRVVETLRYFGRRARGLKY